MLFGSVNYDHEQHGCANNQYLLISPTMTAIDQKQVLQTEILRRGQIVTDLSTDRKNVTGFSMVRKYVTDLNTDQKYLLHMVHVQI